MSASPPLFVHSRRLGRMMCLSERTAEVYRLPLVVRGGARPRHCRDIPAARLLTFLVNNRCDLIDYPRARMSGRRVSSASAE